MQGRVTTLAHFKNRIPPIAKSEEIKPIATPRRINPPLLVKKLKGRISCKECVVASIYKMNQSKKAMPSIIATRPDPIDPRKCPMF